ncbi:MAG: DUF1868 domain-containing protein [Chloroflexota bacterium]
MHNQSFTSAVGQKFHPNGRVRTFPGNTIISFVPPNSPIFAHTSWVQAQIQALPFAHKFGFLPPSSFHMTVMELLCDQVRLPERWSDQLPLDAPLRDVDQFFTERVPHIPPPAALRMRFVEVAQYTPTLNLMPDDEETAVSLQTYRNAIATATGVRFPDHDSYQYHISTAYRLINLSAAEEDQLAATLQPINATLRASFGLFAPPPPQLTFFDDMFAFYPIGQRTQLTNR